MLLSAFNDMPDHRRDQGKRFKLGPLLAVICTAILAGSKEYIEIASFVDEQLRVLKELFKLRWKDPPSYATIRRICIWSSEQDLEKVFRRYSTKLGAKNSTMRLVAIDGKTLKKSGNTSDGVEPIQLISAFLAEQEIVLGHETITGEKTNEIPKVRELIKKLGLQEHVFTMDAMHCQYETLKVIVESENDAIVQVKDNQKKLHQLCQKVSNGWRPVDQDVQVNYDHNRRERRVVKTYLPNQYFKDRLDERWEKYVQVIIKVERTRSEFNTEMKEWNQSYENSYYIGTKVFTASDANIYVRGHWGVENKLHYVRDRAMKEDDCQVCYGANSLAKLRSFVLNILKCNGVKNVKNELFRNGINLDRITKYDYLFG